MTEAVLSVRGLTVAYQSQSKREVEVVHDLDLDLVAGRITGIAGESGCGKSTAALASIGFRAGGAVIKAGTASFGGRDLLQLSSSQLRQIWGRRIGYVPQAASTSLNPSMRIGAQLREVVSMGGRYSDEVGAELLDRVGIPSSRAALRRYPHQFSGGQQQRVAIALAIAPRPEVLILDEPATGLDVTTQARINQLLKELLHESGAAALYVSHDLALLSSIVDDFTVMYAGEVIEHATLASDLVADARHPYTKALLDCVPDVNTGRKVLGIPGLPPPAVVVDSCAFAPRCPLASERCRAEHPTLDDTDGHAIRCFNWRSAVRRDPPGISPEVAVAGTAANVLEVSDVTFQYPGSSRPTLADISLAVAPGETIGVVGESGSGKTTLLRLIAGIYPVSSGQITFRDGVLGPMRERSQQQLGAIQIVFQNPASSLNPRHSVEATIRRPIELFRPDVGRDQRGAIATQLLDAVRLPPSIAHRYPAELSGGQQQRVAIARAFAANPAVLLCDEVTSALDVSVQATVLELVQALAADYGTAVIFVSHDLGVIRTIAHRALVMQNGVIREHGATRQIFEHPADDYTRELIRSTVAFAPAAADASADHPVTLTPRRD